jgi:predicted O-methyltransferase YrrM
METKKHRDLFLVNQEFARYLYRDSAPYEDALYELVSMHSARFQPDGLRIETSSHMELEEMSSPAFLIAFVNAIVQMTGAKTVLEVGTFVGSSTMQFAKMVGPAGHVTTLEIGKEFAGIARRNFAQNGLADRITLIEGDAGASLAGLPKRSFDLIFIDGDKERYFDLALEAETLVTDNGVIIVDDVFFHGDAVNAVPSTPKGLGCKRLIEHYRVDDRFGHLLLPIRNGLLVLFRRHSA